LHNGYPNHIRYANPHSQDQDKFQLYALEMIPKALQIPVALRIALFQSQDVLISKKKIGTFNDKPFQGRCIMQTAKAIELFREYHGLNSKKIL